MAFHVPERNNPMVKMPIEYSHIYVLILYDFLRKKGTKYEKESVLPIVFEGMQSSFTVYTIGITLFFFKQLSLRTLNTTLWSTTIGKLYNIKQACRKYIL